MAGAIECIVSIKSSIQLSDHSIIHISFVSQQTERAAAKYDRLLQYVAQRIENCSVAVVTTTRKLHANEHHLLRFEHVTYYINMLFAFFAPHLYYYYH